MKFMNEYEVIEASVIHKHHPVLGPATQTLRNLMDAANRCSDGWAYWPKPANSARKLMELIDKDLHGYAADRRRLDATPALLKAAYAPIKAFRTKHGKIEFEIVEVQQS